MKLAEPIHLLVTTHVTRAFNVTISVDAEMVDFTDNFLINATARIENYSDFESFVWKLGYSLQIADGKATLRASASTGFKAPTLHKSTRKSSV
jgi:iron complex outermembrane receptor protein